MHARSTHVESCVTKRYATFDHRALRSFTNNTFIFPAHSAYMYVYVCIYTNICISTHPAYVYVYVYKKQMFAFSTHPAYIYICICRFQAIVYKYTSNSNPEHTSCATGSEAYMYALQKQTHTDTCNTPFYISQA